MGLHRRPPEACFGWDRFVVPFFSPLVISIRSPRVLTNEWKYAVVHSPPPKPFPRGKVDARQRRRMRNAVGQIPRFATSPCLLRCLKHNCQSGLSERGNQQISSRRPHSVLRGTFPGGNGLKVRRKNKKPRCQIWQRDRFLRTTLLHPISGAFFLLEHDRHSGSGGSGNRQRLILRLPSSRQ